MDHLRLEEAVLVHELHAVAPVPTSWPAGEELEGEEPVVEEAFEHLLAMHEELWW